MKELGMDKFGRCPELKFTQGSEMKAQASRNKSSKLTGRWVEDEEPEDVDSDATHGKIPNKYVKNLMHKLSSVESEVKEIKAMILRMIPPMQSDQDGATGVHGHTPDIINSKILHMANEERDPQLGTEVTEMQGKLVALHTALYKDRRRMRASPGIVHQDVTNMIHRAKKNDTITEKPITRARKVTQPSISSSIDAGNKDQHAVDGKLIQEGTDMQAEVVASPTVVPKPRRTTRVSLERVRIAEIEKFPCPKDKETITNKGRMRGRKKTGASRPTKFTHCYPLMMRDDDEITLFEKWYREHIKKSDEAAATEVPSIGKV